MTIQDRIQDGYLTSEQAAHGLGISRRTLHRWGRLKKGPPSIKVGRSVFYRRASIERWLLALEGDESLGATVAKPRR